MRDIPFHIAVRQAGALLAMGQNEVYLPHDDDLPWHLVTDVEPGCTHRLDIATSVWMTARHECGINFRWSFDIDLRGASESSSYQIDTDGCRKVMEALPESARSKFRKYLLDCAAKLDAKGAEYQKAADEQYRDGRILRDIAIN